MVVFTPLWFAVLYLTEVKCFSGELFRFREPLKCNETQYFNSVSWKCLECDDTRNLRPSEGGLSCVCNDSSITVGGDDAGLPLCKSCDQNSTADQLRQKCILCAGASALLRNASSAENSSTLVCAPCGKGEIRVERFSNGSLQHEVQCVRCAEGTVPQNGKCVPCALTGAPVNSCRCEKSHEELAGHCVSRGKLLEWPNEKTTFLVEFERDLKVDSQLLRDELRPAVYKCKIAKNHTACQCVANLCTLTLFGDSRRNAACRLFWEARSTPSLSAALPTLMYGDGDAPAVLGRRKIPVKFGLDPFSVDSLLNLTLASFALDGRFLGFSTATTDQLSFCTAPGEQLRFGAPFSISCLVGIDRLLAAGQQPRMHQIFVKYVDQNEEHLHTAPVLILNMRDGDRHPNKQADISQWQLVQRFFLADSLLGHPYNVEAEAASLQQQKAGLKNIPAVLRYAQSIHIKVRVRNDEERGRIFPPLVIVEYVEIRKEQIIAGAAVTSSLTISFHMESDLAHAIEVSVVVLSVLALLLAGVQTLSYWRRSGRVSLELTTLLRLVLLTAGRLADAFFIVVAGAAIHTFIFYKGQAIVHVLLPGPAEENLIFSYIAAAFSLKCVEAIDLVWRQVNVDIFLLDWERPRAPIGLPPLSPSMNGQKSTSQPVSVWRTYFVANEWNELQTLRQISVPLHLLLVLLFLRVLGFEEWANAGPHGPPDRTCRFALGVLVYITVYGVQYVLGRCVYERFVKNAVQDFVDVCSLANISVFVIALDNYGFYIHGRSAHGFADTDMQTMLKQLRREEEDLAGHRGLLPEGDHQTFSMLLPSQLRACYSRVMAPLTSDILSPSKRLSALAGRNGIKVADDRNVQAYHSMNHLLSAFLEHALKDIDYEVKNKTIAESILDMEFSPNDGRGIFYTDDGRSFTSVVFYGSEWTLLTFDLLVFSFTEQLSGDYLLAAIITGLAAQALAAVRHFAGRRNLAKKTLIDERFLI